jgi:hypothetical protein
MINNQKNKIALGFMAIETSPILVSHKLALGNLRVPLT